ncbi:MAG: UDP-N-acetylmuramoyl-L-alanine--D-glutamate ligase, partial [Candidatus Methylumidiphilus sp.]
MSEANKTQGLSRLGLDKSSRVLVVGLGLTGSSVARFLSGHGIQLAVTDTRPNPPGLAELRESLPDVAVFLGGFDATAFARATHLVVSPGVALDAPPIRQAIRAGVPVFGDLDLFACMALAPIIGITGSNGKSTVTTLLGLMAEADGRKVKVGGNLGTPMLDLLDQDADLYVLELSSFQLERSTLLAAAAATVLNISPDHMDRYASLADYAEAKRRIFRGHGLMVLNADDPAVEAMAEAGRACARFSLQDSSHAEYRLAQRDGKDWLLRGAEPLLPVAEIRIKG